MYLKCICMAMFWVYWTIWKTQNEMRKAKFLFEISLSKISLTVPQNEDFTLSPLVKKILSAILMKSSLRKH